MVDIWYPAEPADGTPAPYFDLLVQLDSRQDASLRLAGGGAYRILMNAANTTHADFGDLLFLQSATARETEARAQILEIRSYHHPSLF